MSYAIFAPAGFSSSEPPKRRTTQEFQLDDDLGDGRASALGYGGRIRPAQFAPPARSGRRPARR